jgi:hypothetical protein
MNSSQIFIRAIALIVGITASAVGSAAQRTFVASYGNDLDACTIAAPCRGFARALTQTDAKGEIIVLDSAGYGRVTIDRSVAITAPSGVYAGISVFAGTNGVDVAGANIVVALRGLTINGQGGDYGIAFTQGGRLYIEQCVVSNMNGRGISLETGDTFITDSTIRDNSSFGVWAQGSLELVMDRTRIERNGYTGLRIANGPAVTVTNSVIAGNFGFGGVDIDSDDGASQTVVSITDSNVSQNSTQGIIARATNAGTIVRLAVARNTIARNGATGVWMSAATGTLTAVVADNTIVRNFGSGGIYASGAAVSATIANNAVSGNGTYGVRQQTSALLKTRANNVVQDNTTDTSGTLTFVGGD